MEQKTNKKPQIDKAILRTKLVAAHFQIDFKLCYKTIFIKKNGIDIKIDT